MQFLWFVFLNTELSDSCNKSSLDVFNPIRTFSDKKGVDLKIVRSFKKIISNIIESGKLPPLIYVSSPSILYLNKGMFK